jgi:hypothetical protein
MRAATAHPRLDANRDGDLHENLAERWVSELVREPLGEPEIA